MVSRHYLKLLSKLHMGLSCLLSPQCNSLPCFSCHTSWATSPSQFLVSPSSEAWPCPTFWCFWCSRPSWRIFLLSSQYRLIPSNPISKSLCLKIKLSILGSFEICRKVVKMVQEKPPSLQFSSSLLLLISRLVGCTCHHEWVKSETSWLAKLHILFSASQDLPLLSSVLMRI